MDHFTTLSDYRTRVADLYAQVRQNPEPPGAWATWRSSRDILFSTHPQSPLEPADRPGGYQAPFLPYDPAFRVSAPLMESVSADGPSVNIAHSDTGKTPFAPVGTVSGVLPTGPFSLTVYWLDSYGGGLFVPFRDTTNGTGTYGGGRYLLDTVKGADLGSDDRGLVLDFNFAYHPSCVHSYQWSCPLAPPENHLAIDVPAGEQLGSE
jgi:uncharacterized protein (DUF1684 family)